MSAGLVLEGGGNRNAYTAGVLDVLTENNIFFTDTYAVSTGAVAAMSYISKQKQRTLRLFTDYLRDKRFMSLSLMRKTGNLYGTDFIFGEIFGELLPFDKKEFLRSMMKFSFFATDCRTGKPVAFEKNCLENNYTPIIASTALPVISEIIQYNNMPLLGGSISCSIPVKEAFSSGIDAALIVLTRDRNYVKRNGHEFPLTYLRRKYRDYPALTDTLASRAEKYNDERTFCYELQKEGRAIVLQPSFPITIRRYSHDADELKRIYQMGVRDAQEHLVEIRRLTALF